MRVTIHGARGKMTRIRAAVRHAVRQTITGQAPPNILNIVIKDDAYLRGLNKEYFHKKRPTNVISFDLGDVWEIYVSRDRARDAEELNYYIMHGLLHLMGYDHNTRRDKLGMHRKCIELLQNE